MFQIRIENYTQGHWDREIIIDNKSISPETSTIQTIPPNGIHKLC